MILYHFSAKKATLPSRMYNCVTQIEQVLQDM